MVEGEVKSIILARVSTEDQLKEGFSIEAQIDRARNYRDKQGLEHWLEFEFDESSTSDQRI